MIEESQVPESARPERAPSHGTRSPTVPIPQDPEGRAGARAEILVRVIEFIKNTQRACGFSPSPERGRRIVARRLRDVPRDTDRHI